MNIKKIILIIVYLCSFYGLAQANPTVIDQLIAEANKAQLSKSKTWLKLGHYQKKASSHYQSDILSRKFFLANKGQTSPQKELEATIKAFFEPIQAKSKSTSANKIIEISNNSHPQCKYPARYMWLNEKLNLESHTIPKPNCQRFNEWSNDEKIESVSIVFATGYLKNPASYYGHLLLKFNTHNGNLSDDFLNKTLNYGAIVPPNENQLIYIVKGVFGGYPASYSNQFFFRQNHNYSEEQLRDLWEYQLNLSNRDVQFLVAHSWELLGKEYRYYFFNDNCATRMADLLELVVPDKILPRHTPWSLPYSVFDGLLKQKNELGPLVKDVRYFPSRLNRLFNRYELLSEKEKILVFQQTQQFNLAKNKTFQNLPTESKVQILDTLFDYTAFRLAKNKNNPSINKLRQQLLLTRLSIPKFESKKLTFNKQSPDKTNKPTQLQFSILNNSTNKYLGAIRFRPAYFDTLSLDEGRNPHSTLKMFETHLQLSPSKIQISQLNFLELSIFQGKRTPLPGTNPKSWRLRAAIDRNNLKRNNKKIALIEGGIGKSSQKNKTLIYAMLDGRLQTGYDLGTIFIKPSIGGIYSPTLGFKSMIELGYKQFIDGKQEGNTVLAFKNRFGKNPKRDIRLYYLIDRGYEIKLAQGFYW